MIIGLQLFLWTLSGLIFAWIPIEEVRGETLLKEDQPQLHLESAADAIAAAQQALIQPAEINGAELIHQAPNEYRGGPLPAWRVDFEDAVTLYLDPETAKVNAVRSTKWRIFDFFWMLHIMDYDERDDFNNPLLIIAAAFGVVTSATGLLLAFVVYKNRLSRRRPAPEGSAKTD